jgi:hypothetical protein
MSDKNKHNYFCLFMTIMVNLPDTDRKTINCTGNENEQREAHEGNLKSG